MLRINIMPPKKKRPIKKKVRKPKATQEQKQTQKVIVNIGNVKKPVKRRRKVAQKQQSQIQTQMFVPTTQVRYITSPDQPRDFIRDRLSSNLVATRREHGTIMEQPPQFNQPQMVREPQQPVGQGRPLREASDFSDPRSLTPPPPPQGLTPEPELEAMMAAPRADAARSTSVPQAEPIGATPATPQPPSMQFTYAYLLNSANNSLFTEWARRQGYETGTLSRGSSGRRNVLDDVWKQRPRTGTRI